MNQELTVAIGIVFFALIVVILFLLRITVGFCTNYRQTHTCKETVIKCLKCAWLHTECHGHDEQPDRQASQGDAEQAERQVSLETAYQPPEYEDALNYPRLDSSTILGDPPPKYSSLSDKYSSADGYTNFGAVQSDSYMSHSTDSTFVDIDDMEAYMTSSVHEAHTDHTTGLIDLRGGNRDNPNDSVSTSYNETFPQHPSHASMPDAILTPQQLRRILLSPVSMSYNIRNSRTVGADLSHFRWRSDGHGQGRYIPRPEEQSVHQFSRPCQDRTSNSQPGRILRRFHSLESQSVQQSSDCVPSTESYQPWESRLGSHIPGLESVEPRECRVLFRFSSHDSWADGENSSTTSELPSVSRDSMHVEETERLPSYDEAVEIILGVCSTRL